MKIKWTGSRRFSRGFGRPRLRFEQALKSNARSWGLALSETIGFEFRRRYGLTPRDRRYLELTDEEIVVDYWAHRHADDPELRKEDFDPAFDAEVEAMDDMPPDLPPDGETVPDDFETIHDDILG